jgi:F-type H+-transporting ATPase subunit a
MTNISEELATVESKDTTEHNFLNSNVEKQNTAQDTALHTKKAEGENKNEVFKEVLGELGDSYGLVIGPYHIADLPMIIYDNGLYTYSSPKAMEEAGIFKMSKPEYKGEPIRKSDNHKPALDLSITNLVCFQWIAIILLLVVFKITGGRYKKNKNKAPTGIQNVIEAVFLYIKDEIIGDNVGGEKVSLRLLPYFVALFFFILTMNLTGLIPGGHTATGSIGTTAALALTAFIVINFTAIREAGMGHWFKHLLGGAPVWLAPLMIPIELISMLIKPFALTIRLFANMTAGHVVLLSLLGLMFYFQTIIISPAIVGFSLFIMALELLVAVIQAFIFTMLTAIFTGLAIGEHPEH